MSEEASVAPILASASPIRARLLAAAGVSFEVAPARIDEPALRAALQGRGAAAAEAAEALAEAKAVEVSGRWPGRLVIGADQILDCDGAWLEKPRTREAARRDLVRLRGRAHRQVTAVCLVRDRSRRWGRVETVGLSVRDFSDRFLEAYLDAGGADILGCPGAYQLEGPGVQLFSAVEGDYFAVLGLPLLPLIEALRRHRVLMT